MASRYACVVGARHERLALLTETAPPDFVSLRRIILQGAGTATRDGLLVVDDQLAPLQHAITSFEEFMTSASAGFNFFSDLLPHIHSWALSSTSDPDPIRLPLLQCGIASRNPISRSMIRTVLSNAFFLNVLPFPDSTSSNSPRFGNISLMGLYTSPYCLAKERLLCLLAYFTLALHLDPEELNEEVCFERHLLSASETPDWMNMDVAVDVNRIHIHTERMENSKARAFMDFANEAIHIHMIIPSATQEEILFSACPEAFVGILISEVMRDDEVIVIRNVRRFVEYTGYSLSFKFAGFYPNVKVHDILVADATQSGQFTEQMIKRDLNKAYLAFAAVSTKVPSPTSMCPYVSTSHWGCGAFGGDKHLKFLQQVCASMLTGLVLDYSTFGDSQMANSFNHLLSIISANSHTVGSICHALCGYKREEGTFADRIARKLSRN